MLIDGRKACGILLELAAEATRVAFLVLGIGVNLNVDPATFPEEFRASATSLCARTAAARSTAPRSRARCSRRSSACSTPARRAGSVGYCPGSRRASACAGAACACASSAASEQEGRVHGIDDDGALRLALAGGAQMRFLAGDVYARKEEAA